MSYILTGIEEKHREKSKVSDVLAVLEKKEDNVMRKTSAYYSAAPRRHLNPTCSCPDCTAFDESPTLPMQHIRTDPVIMTAIHTETSERFTYYFDETSASLLETPEELPNYCIPQSSHERPTFQTLLHAFVTEKIRQSVQAHPFIWLCISTIVGWGSATQAQV